MKSDRTKFRLQYFQDLEIKANKEEQRYKNLFNLHHTVNSDKADQYMEMSANMSQISCIANNAYRWLKFEIEYQRTLFTVGFLTGLFSGIFVGTLF